MSSSLPKSSATCAPTHATNPSGSCSHSIRAKHYSKISTQEFLSNLRISVNNIRTKTLGFVDNNMCTQSFRASLIVMSNLAMEMICTIMFVLLNYFQSVFALFCLGSDHLSPVALFFLGKLHHSYVGFIKHHVYLHIS